VTATTTRKTLSWGHDALRLDLWTAAEGTARLGLGAPAGAAREGALPLVEVTAAGHGRHWSSHRLVDSTLGTRLRHRAHHVTREGAWHVLTVELRDPDTGLAAEAVYRSPEGVPALCAEVTLRNEGAGALHLESVTSLVLGGITDVALDTADVWWAGNDWLAEFRWQRRPLRAALPQLSGRVRYGYGKGSFALAGQGTWSSCGHLPMGALTDRASGRAWVWQVEHNGGGWRWDCGERHDTAYLALSGPTDGDHGWRHRLEPGGEFRAVRASVAFGDGLDDAFGALTRYRRATRRPHPDHEKLPVVFNDYMNCLMGDPTTAKLLPLVDAAADAGAECFVIDAGWYDDDAGWWDGVGAWEPSSTRFPGPRGIHEVLDRIRARGMVPGLWLEPEVVGVRSPVAAALPDEAFFRRDGVRVVESGRHQLDLRHPAARAHLDAVVDRLAGEWGVGYLKLDHNIDAGSGTSGHPGEVPAAGALGHHRAHLAWLDGVLDRHPHLVLEDCASGGMRADHALLSRMQLLSTSDQQNLLHYATIAAAAPTAVTPEQGAVWAYPQPGDTPDEVAFTLVSALLGRVHLSGQPAGLGPEARALVHEAVAAYRGLRADLPDALPLWPLGLPAWDDPWVALALRAPTATYLTAWRRPGAGPATALHLPHLSGTSPAVTPVFPADTRATTAWDPGAAALTLTLPAVPSAVLLRLS
jgi:alpha-galactosidase